MMKAYPLCFRRYGRVRQIGETLVSRQLLTMNKPAVRFLTRLCTVCPVRRLLGLAPSRGKEPQYASGSLRSGVDRISRFYTLCESTLLILDCPQQSERRLLGLC